MRHGLIENRRLIRTPVDQRFLFCGCLPPQIAPSRARFSRPAAGEHCFCHDSAGARVRFRTDATEVTARIRYNRLHTLRDAANGVGAWTMDGTLAGTFRHGAEQSDGIEVMLAAHEPSRVRDYEIILPYGDSTDFEGLVVNAGAAFLPPPPPPRIRCVTHGDSITQGFWANDVTHTFPYQVGERLGWEMVNLGIAGRKATASDGEWVGAVRADVVTILIGFNDYHQATPLEEFAGNLRAALRAFRRAQPRTPLGLITPLWSNGLPVIGDGPRLEVYRDAMRRVAAELCDDRLTLIEGPALVPGDPALFRDGIHPNDRGFAILSDSLVERLPRLL